MDIWTIVTLYLAFLTTVYFHEIGHMGKKVVWKKILIFPYSAYSYGSKDTPFHRLGGLVVNALLFLSVFYFKPEMLFLQLVGLVAWTHFMLYLIVGSIVPETNGLNIDIKKYVFDDVDNQYWYIFIPLAIFTFIYFKSYYVPISLSLW